MGALFFATTIAAMEPLGIARADCVDECQRAYGSCFGMDQNACLERLQQCYRQQCDKPQVSYGAIAYGAKSAAYGYSFDERSSRDADRKALANCQPNGDDCRVVSSFSNSCAAVAAVESKGVFSTDSGGTQESAEDSASKVAHATTARVARSKYGPAQSRKR